MRNYRLTDPETSILAGNYIEGTGQAQYQRQRCYNAVTHSPGLTAAEIADLLKIERHIPSRRLPELRKEGKVTNGESRQCRAQGTQAMTWYPTGSLFGE